MSVTKPESGADFAARLNDLQAAATRGAAMVARSRQLLARLQPQAAPPSTDAAFDEFQRRLASDGVRAALAYLLGLSDYRFIGIFRFQDGMANAAVHVDREHPEQLTATEVPDTATYCCYVRDGNGAFVTVHAALDPRLAGHAARDAVQAYCGVPVLAADGELIGTLCHYDLVPRDAGGLDQELLLRVADALAQPGLVPPYPRS